MGFLNLVHPATVHRAGEVAEVQAEVGKFAGFKVVVAEVEEEAEFLACCHPFALCLVEHDRV